MIKYAKVSIIYPRDDGDYELLATLNNTATMLEHQAFNELVESTLATFRACIGEEVQVVEREDAPDLITIDDN